MASTLKVNTIAHSGGTTAMTIDSSGFAKQAALPCFQARGADSSASTKIDLTNNTWADVPYNTLNAPESSQYSGFNIGSHYDLSNYRFKPTLAGKWWLHAKGYLTYGGDAPTAGFMRFWDGTNTHGNSYIRDAADGTYGTIEISGIFNMSGNGSDYLKIQVKASGSTDADFYYGSYLGMFEGYYLGA